MSRRPPFEPIGFALELEKTSNYAADNGLINYWSGTHCQPLNEIESECRLLRWIVAPHRQSTPEQPTKLPYAGNRACLPCKSRRPSSRFQMAICTSKAAALS